MTDETKCPSCGHKPPRSERKQPEERREQILLAAVNLAAERGYTKITQSEIAEAANVSHGLVSRYFETMEGLRAAVMHHAITKEIPRIILQGLALKDPIAARAPLRLKAKAINECNL